MEEMIMTESIEQVSSKVMRRLIPFIMLLFFISLIDRANISYAALQMNKDLGFAPNVYGSAAGIFFIGYFLFEIPSNIALTRFGAKRWLGRIMISWGIVSIAMAWISGEKSLYALRFLLGLAEAGLLPGVMFYLARWVPGRARGKTLSILMATTAIAYVVGGPFSTLLMSLDGILGFRGWQFMFVVEGIPAIVVGILTMMKLPERPGDAAWLSPEERHVLDTAIQDEQSLKSINGPATFLAGLTDRRILLASAFTFFSICDNFGTVFWLPQIIKAFGNLTNIEVGFLSTIPYALGGVGMIVWGRHSDRSGDRRMHMFIGACVATVGYAAAAMASEPITAFIGICVAAIGVWSCFGLIWAYAGDLVAGPAAATGFAVINSIGTLGGFVGPFLIGWIRASTHSFTGGLFVLAGFGVVTALLALALEHTSSPPATGGVVADGVA